MDRVRLLEKPLLRTDLPRPEIGDTVAVSVKIKEGDKERVQTFTGTVIGMRGGGLGETFTVRRIVAGEGVERIFPLHSPVIAGLSIESKGRVRRAKLGYLRGRKGKSTRLTAIIGDEGHGPDAGAGLAADVKAAQPKAAQPKADAPAKTAAPPKA